MQKLRALLRSEGELHVLDWGTAQDPLMRTLFLTVQVVDGFARTSANVRGELASFMRTAGVDDAAEVARRRTMFGALSLYRATV